MTENILLILSTFEEEIKEKLQKTNRQLEQVKYYEEFEIKGIQDIEFLGIFVTTEIDADGNKKISLYDGDPTHQILLVDEMNNVEIEPELSKYFEEIDLPKTIIQNDEQKGRLKGISEPVKPEDLEIANFREIKDNNLERQLPGIFSPGAEQKGCGYSRKLNAFVIVEKVGGVYRQVEEIEPAVPTMKTIISVNENGEEIEQKVPHALMKLTSNSDKEISITIGEYGYVETGIVDVLPCSKRVEMQLREDGEGLSGQRTKKLEDLTTKYGQEELHELVHKYSKELSENDDDDEIILEDL